MADNTGSSLAPLTEDAFLADRMAFWQSFTGFTFVSVIILAVILIAMAIFLV
jgi:hypothetical protein